MKNTKPKMDWKTAESIARDAANRQMRKAGRSSWNEDDYNLAVNTFDSLCPVAPPTYGADVYGNLKVIV